MLKQYNNWSIQRSSIYEHSFHCRYLINSLMDLSLPTMQETWVRFLGQEDPQEKEMAINSNILAWQAR